MKVVLKQDIKGTGKKDELVEVSDGYARNYLFPRKLAVEANATAINDIKNKEAAKQHRADEELKHAQELAKSLNGTNLTVKVKTSPNGKIFGAVTSIDVANAIKDVHNLECDRKKIRMDDIKNLGEYTVTLKLHSGVTAEMKLTVESL